MLVVLCSAAVVAPVRNAGAAEPVFRTPEAALKQGLGAFRGGYYEIAVPALEFAAHKDSLLAKYYLAQIYSDNLGTRTDHARAFEIYRSIVKRYSDTDPDLDPRAPLIGQAVTAYAKYLRTGLSEIGLKPDPVRAEMYFSNASSTFNNENAQFELAKMYLSGEGVRHDYQMARHWLSSLTRKGHPGAQAFLADLLWRGKHVAADPVRALALIVVAVKNAPPQERLWIEDIYQMIYCGASKGVRKQATGIVAEWGKRYGRRSRHSAVGKRTMYGDARPIRTCQNGETVGSMWAPRVHAADDDADKSSAPKLSGPDSSIVASPPLGGPRFSLGGATGKRTPGPGGPALGLRDVSTPAPSGR